VFPLIEADPSVFVYAADFSAEAVELVKSHPQFDARRICPLVFDITAADPAAALPAGALGTVDTVVCVFVLSALDPSTWPSAARNLRLLLRPGGRVLFRDYGRHDLAQLRLPAGRLLTDGLYTRGDGTRVYFFEEDDLDRLFDGLVRESVAVDRRLLVNRARKLEMYRVWIQAKYRRPVGDA
ncbi:Methyltransferase-like protein 2-A, partial [Cladochytrium tenue]